MTEKDTEETSVHPLSKLSTGIPGFEFISEGGLPAGRTTLTVGSAGSAKTTFGVQFLLEGIRQFNQNGIFVTFEESPEMIRQNALSLGWDILELESGGNWVFVDVTPHDDGTYIETGQYDLEGLMVRIRLAVERSGARRLVIDSLGALFEQFNSRPLVRQELIRLVSELKRLGITTVLTAERPENRKEISTFGVEEFVTDSVVILRNTLEVERRRRTIEILKMRGSNHKKGEFPFTVGYGQGMTITALAAVDLNQPSSVERISSGIPDLDELCQGGFFKDSVVLVAGATGCGKTLLACTFADGGVQHGERCLFISFEEGVSQIVRNAENWGLGFQAMQSGEGPLALVSTYPETETLEDHLIKLDTLIDRHNPSRVVLDSLTALGRIASERSFKQFLVSLTSKIKSKGIACLYTVTSHNILGGESVADAQISSVTDTIINLRYLEIEGKIRRGLNVLKMRGSMHAKEIYEFDIDGNGVHIRRPFHRSMQFYG
jgi:circadian clock protein KaiC